jgi:hypothetical protein
MFPFRDMSFTLGDRWHVDETYVKVNGVWRYVYRAHGQHGQVIDVLVGLLRVGAWDRGPARRGRATPSGCVSSVKAGDRSRSLPSRSGQLGEVGVSGSPVRVRWPVTAHLAA